MKTTLAEIVDMVGGGTPSKAIDAYWGGNIPWASVKDFKTSELINTGDSITELGLKNSASHLIPAGNIIIPTRMALGKVAVNLVDMAINQDLRALIVKDEKAVNKRYLVRFLESKAKYLEGEGKGATVKGITLDVLRGLEVPLPPLPEQRRIAAILDQADALRAKRREALAQLDSLTQSIFIEMFGNTQSIYNKWPTKPLGELLEFLTSGSRGWAEYYSETGALFLRIQNVGGDALNLTDVAYVTPPDSAEARRTQVREGDVLLSITADLGRTGVVPAGLGRAHINQHLSILRTKKVVPRYLSAFLTSPAGQREVMGRNKQGVKAGLNFDDIRSFRIPMPPEVLQMSYVSRAEKIEDHVKRLQTSLNEIESLFNSLQHRAFRGEL